MPLERTPPTFWGLPWGALLNGQTPGRRWNPAQSGGCPAGEARHGEYSVFSWAPLSLPGVAGTPGRCSKPALRERSCGCTLRSPEPLRETWTSLLGRERHQDIRDRAQSSERRSGAQAGLPARGPAGLVSEPARAETRCTGDNCRGSGPGPQSAPCTAPFTAAGTQRRSRRHGHRMPGEPTLLPESVLGTPAFPQHEPGQDVCLRSPSARQRGFPPFSGHCSRGRQCRKAPGGHRNPKGISTSRGTAPSATDRLFRWQRSTDAGQQRVGVPQGRHPRVMVLGHATATDVPGGHPSQRTLKTNLTAGKTFRIGRETDQPILRSGEPSSAACLVHGPPGQPRSDRWEHTRHTRQAHEVARGLSHVSPKAKPPALDSHRARRHPTASSADASKHEALLSSLHTRPHPPTRTQALRSVQTDGPARSADDTERNLCDTSPCFPASRRLRSRMKTRRKKHHKSASLRLKQGDGEAGLRGPLSWRWARPGRVRLPQACSPQRPRLPCSALGPGEGEVSSPRAVGSRGQPEALVACGSPAGL